MNWDFLPVLQECMSASDWRIESYAGTPKTLDNTLCKLWNRSSQGEWVITCRSCRKDNVPSIAEDLLNMIGKKTIVCSKCGYPLHTEDGRWIHKFPDRIPDFLGMHVSQPILPLHHGNPRAWGILKEKMKELPKRTVWNEVLGEDCDIGAKVIPVSVLQNASVLPFFNGSDDPLRWIKKGRYLIVSLGADWGGRGESGDSFTAFVISGLRSDGRVDILFGEKLPPSDDDIAEVNRISQLYRAFGCNCIGHDFRGVGQSKDTQLIQSGFKHACPWSNEPGTCKFFAKTSRNQTGRVFVQINRAAAVMLIAHEITHGRMFLPAWPEDTQLHPFLDLNSWYEEFTAQPDGRDLYRVMRSAALPDDVGMALIYSICTAYRRCQAWPKFMSKLLVLWSQPRHPIPYLICTEVSTRELISPRGQMVRYWLPAKVTIPPPKPQAEGAESGSVWSEASGAPLRYQAGARHD